MSDRTQHRGPDATGTFADRGVALAHNRLSIIDLSPEANQPLHSGDGRYVIVFNGEIYNYRELKNQLPNWDFKTKSDTEVLLAAYATWGDEMFSRIRGIFAFAIWDTKMTTLILARDHLGVKPLFFVHENETLYFSSELRALIAGTGHNTVNQNSFANFIGLGYVPGPMSFIEGVQKLPPAHMAKLEKGTFSVRRYWTPRPPTVSMPTTADIQDTIHQAVTDQLVADRPVGIFLSGGFDSSILVHHASKAAESVRTFTSQFMLDGVDTDKYNLDAVRAKQTAAHYGTEHTTYTIRNADIQNNLERALLSLDEPIANATSVTQFLLSKWIREDGIVVALGGDGGDELFGGYQRHRYALAASYYQRLPSFVRTLGSALDQRLEKLNMLLGPSFHYQLMCQKENTYASALTGQCAVRETVQKIFAERYGREYITALHPLDQFMRVDRETWLVDESLARTDNTSMACGLEVRVPLLDVLVLELADGIQGTRKCTLRTGKRIIRDAYRGMLPDYLYEGPKQGWFSPGAKWLRDKEVLAFARNVLTDKYYSGLSDWIDWDGVSIMLEKHIEKRGYFLYPLWNLLVLQLWARENHVKVG